MDFAFACPLLFCSLRFEVDRGMLEEALRRGGSANIFYLPLAVS